MRSSSRCCASLARAAAAALTAGGDAAAAARPHRLLRPAAAAASFSTSPAAAAAPFSSTSSPPAAAGPPLDRSIADAARGGRPSSSSPSTADVVIVGGGHNALVAAALLARSGLSVRLFEARARLGGACVTTHPFKNKAPGLAHSLGAYLLGPWPPELLTTLGLDDLPIIRRDPHYFLPTPAGARGGGGYVLFGRDKDATKAQFVSMFTQQDWEANERLNAELAAIREDFATALLIPDGGEAPSLEAVLQRHTRPDLRPAMEGLLTGSVAAYLARFGFASDLVPAMYAATDGLSGSSSSPYDAGTGYNFLVHNMVRLEGSGGAWALVRGGMGTLTARLAGAARRAGARIETACPVASIDTVDDTGRRRVTGVTLADGRTVGASAVLAGADPWTAAGLLDAGGGAALPATYRARLDALRRPGWTFKVNLALRHLPTYACCPDPGAGQHNTTAHLLAGADSPRAGSGAMEALASAAADAAAGVLPPFPPVEVYTHSAADPSVRDGPSGHHSAALFVQLVPPGPHSARGAQAGDPPGPWTGESASAQAYAAHLLTHVCDAFAPGFSALVDEAVVLTAADIEREFGIASGHIHHADNAAGALDARVPYSTPGVEGLFAGSAACHPGGSVMGVAGHNAAGAVVRAMGVARAGW